MPEEKKLSLYNQQKLEKPVFEDAVNEFLDGEMKDAALEFASYMRTNGTPPKWFRSCGWTTEYKGFKRICDLCLHEIYNDSVADPVCNTPAWGIRLKHLNGFEEAVINEGLADVVWESIQQCMYPSGKSGKNGENERLCAGGRNVTVLGKELRGVCQSRDVVQFYDPDAKTIEGIKKLIELQKKEIDKTAAKKETNVNRDNLSLMRSLSSEQKKSKPTPESLIPDYIPDGEVKDAALELVAFLREKKMNPGWYGVNRWKSSNKGSGICFLRLERGYYNYIPPLDFNVRIDLTHISDYQDEMATEGMRELVLSHINRCCRCSGCAPGKNITLLGEELKDICKTMILHFVNPSEKEVAVIKRLLELEKSAREVK